MEKIKLRKWDAVEYLKTEEDMVLYLQVRIPVKMTADSGLS